MNKKIYILLFSLLVKLNPLFAAQSQPLMATLINFPPEVALEGALNIHAEGYLQLDQNRIDELHKKYEKNFKIRNYLKYGSRALQIGLVGVGLYNMGLFDFLLPKSIGQLSTPDKTMDALQKQMTQVTKNQEELIKLLSDKIGKTPDDLKKIFSSAIADKQSPFDKFSWIWSGVKSVGQWVTISLCFAKAAQLHSYVEAEPTFVWFFSNHSLTDRVDVLRRSVKAITDFNIPANHSLEYHRRAIVPSLDSIARNLEELIAFMDYYFESIDQELLFKQGLDVQSRYLFNVGNDFLRDIHGILQDNDQNLKAVSMIDDFRADLVTVIKRCQFFEKQFVDQD